MDGRKQTLCYARVVVGGVTRGEGRVRSAARHTRPAVPEGRAEEAVDMAAEEGEQTSPSAVRRRRWRWRRARTTTRGDRSRLLLRAAHGEHGRQSE